jgi:hypothetical protein
MGDLAKKPGGQNVARAAFTSRSCTVPQSHVHSRTLSGIFAVTVPQVPHSLELGNQRLITTSSRPYHAHLYSSVMRRSVHAASEMACASGAEQNRDEWELPDGIAAERASHHWIDVASAKVAEGDRAGSFAALQTARRTSPNHTRFHPTIRQSVATLVRLDRSDSDTLTGFAKWAGV